MQRNLEEVRARMLMSLTVFSTLDSNLNTPLPAPIPPDAVKTRLFICLNFTTLHADMIGDIWTRTAYSFLTTQCSAPTRAFSFQKFQLWSPGLLASHFTLHHPTNWLQY